MNRQRTIWWVLSALVIVVTASVTVSGLVTGILQERHTQTDTYTASAIKSVELTTGSASVRVVPTSGGDATVTQEMRWIFSRPTITERLDPATGTLHVDAGCEGGKILGHCDVRLTVAVPAGVPINADGGSGTVDISGMTGPITAQGGSGEIDLERDSGTLDVQVGSGQIVGTSLQSQQVTAKAGSGQVELDFALPPASVTAEVSSGQTSITLPRGQQYRVSSSVATGVSNVEGGLASASASSTVKVSVTSGEADVSYR
ncbi:DUF4097 family beta strand repeat-containing protein [Streptacidiphilus jiangxiensis]|uniref:Uncharacterized protein n=1 Tax=Streptacidiphilus jiangxiensis TaxID=235985 RepID=A0A1H7W2Q7_STRJI|nr:DUF4097 family beta strand repeat-containing protein [Streptacidiphilus jiangxiensis]SEM15790.1 hypothetical protein SAMN05414137_119180 [Streptacidiphilus jiangxiensis]